MKINGHHLYENYEFENPNTGHDWLPCKGKLNSGAQIRCTTSTQGPQCWHISMYGTRYGSLWNTLLSQKAFALWPSALYHFVLFCSSQLSQHKCPCNRTIALHNMYKNALQYSHLLPNFVFKKCENLASKKKKKNLGPYVT
jgi:hypothetical protein